jgi:phosphohistidine phosphatase
MRHGPAEDYAASGRDFDRALTPKGRERVREVARALLAAGEVPAEIVTSPLVRARETAAELLEVFGERPLEIARGLEPGRDVLGLVTDLFSEGRENTVLVGHEPDLSDVVAALVGAHPPPRHAQGDGRVDRAHGRHHVAARARLRVGLAVRARPEDPRPPPLTRLPPRPPAVKQHRKTRKSFAQGLWKAPAGGRRPRVQVSEISG